MAMYKFSVEDFYSLALAGYRYELRGLVSLVNSDSFCRILPSFTNNSKFLAMQRDAVFSGCLQYSTGQSKFSMDLSKANVRVSELIGHVNLAAVCGFFTGWTVPVSSLNDSLIDAYIDRTLGLLPDSKEEKARQIAERLNKADTIRVMMTLKLLGLIEPDSSQYAQLSLGAFYGNRDIEFMHQQPLIQPQGSLPHGDFSLSNVPPLTFSMVSHDANDAVLVDLDPTLADRYADYNAKNRGRILAYNRDVYAALELLYFEITAGTVKPRDLIVVFRLEPKMISNLDFLISRLKRVIDEEAKFIMTIGAGDDVDAYRQRVGMMEKVAVHFADKGLRVARLKWCRGGDAETQRNNPMLGIGNYSSYEILYAELVRARL